MFPLIFSIYFDAAFDEHEWKANIARYCYAHHYHMAFNLWWPTEGLDFQAIFLAIKLDHFVCSQNVWISQSRKQEPLSPKQSNFLVFACLSFSWASELALFWNFNDFSLQFIYQNVMHRILQGSAQKPFFLRLQCWFCLIRMFTFRIISGAVSLFLIHFLDVEQCSQNHDNERWYEK